MDKTWTISGLGEIQSLSIFFPWAISHPQYIHFTVFLAWKNFEQISDTCPTYVHLLATQKRALGPPPMANPQPRQGLFQAHWDKLWLPGWLNKWAVVPVDSPVEMFHDFILSKYNQKTLILISITQWVVLSHLEKKLFEWIQTLARFIDIKSPRIQMVERVWVGSCWAAGKWPKAAGNGLKAHFWVAKSGTQVGHVSDICPKIVLAWKT